MQRSLYHLRPLFHLALFPALAALVGTQLACEKVMFWRPRPQEMHSASDVPASEGTVQVLVGANDNRKVSIRVKHLAQPSKMAPDATVYIVWFKPEGSDPQNVGALVLNDDLEGKLETVTPHHRFQISVTPEPNARAMQPSHEPVFTYSVESNK
jgi:hypothetical protein